MTDLNFLRGILAAFFVVELAVYAWVAGFDQKAAIIMLVYGFICSCRSPFMDEYRRAKKSTDPTPPVEPNH